MLNDESVEVWFVDMDQLDRPLSTLESALDPGELRRANRFRFAVDRRRFIVRRWWLRQFLAHYLPGARVILGTTTTGKPRLANQPNTNALHFNCSHAEHYAAFAFSRVRPVGIDIEKVRSVPQLLEIAGRYFTSQEYHRLRNASPVSQDHLFFTIWTRKEAALKALGHGLQQPLDSIEVVAPGKGREPLVVTANEGEATIRLAVYDVTAPTGFLCAVAIPGAKDHVQVHPPGAELRVTGDS